MMTICFCCTRVTPPAAFAFVLSLSNSTREASLAPIEQMGLFSLLKT